MSFRSLLSSACLLGLAGLAHSQTLIVTPAGSLSFAYTQGGGVPAPRNLTVSSAGGDLSFTISIVNVGPPGSNWLSVGATGGTTSGAVPVSFGPDPAVLAGLAPGGYTATMRFTSPGNPPSDLVTTLTVTAAPQPAVLAVSTTAMTFTHTIGSTPPAARNLTVTTQGGTGTQFVFTAAVSTSNGGSWLGLSATSGTTPRTLSVSVIVAGLPAGSYDGTIELTGEFPTVVVGVTLVVRPGLTISTGSLAFSHRLGDPAPAPQTLALDSTDVPLTFNVNTSSRGNWLQASAATGTTPATLSISISTAGLAIGAQTGTIVINPSGAAAVTLTVTLTVTPPPLAASPTSLTFIHNVGAQPPSSQRVALDTAPAALTYTAATSGAAWLRIGSSSGTTPGNLEVFAVPGALPVGSYTAQVTIALSGAPASAVLVSVTLRVVAPPLSASPGALAFFARAGGSPPDSQRLRVTTEAPGVAFVVAIAGGSWVRTSPVSGTTPGDVNVIVNPAGLGEGRHTATLTILPSISSGASATVTVTLEVLSATAPSVAAVVNAASGAANALAPGALFTIHGLDLAVETLLVSALPLPLSMGGVSVSVDGVAARMVYVSPRQLNGQLAFEVPAGPAVLIVTVNGVPSAPVPVRISAAAPGIFLLPGTNRAVAQNQDLSLNGPGGAAPPGTVLTVYLTGQGDLDNPIATGQAAPAEPLSRPRRAVRVTIGGRPATVMFAGMTPGLAGVMQANILIENLPAGEQPLVVFIGDVASNPATVFVGQ